MDIIRKVCLCVCVWGSLELIFMCLQLSFLQSFNEAILKFHMSFQSQPQHLSKEKHVCKKLWVKFASKTLDKVKWMRWQQCQV